jgi:mono/diheme cytochrome c family protein
VKTFRLMIALCLVFFAVSTVAQSEATLTGNPVYEKNCAKCHGKTATGRHFGGPALVSDKVAAVSPDDLRSIISNGKGHMPKYSGKLTPEEIDSLVKQIEALNKK